MLLSISTTYRPATDLGYLLHKNPSRAQEVQFGFGRAHMFYPEANDERCTFVLLLDIEPIALVRGSGKDGGLLDATKRSKSAPRRPPTGVAVLVPPGMVLGDAWYLVHRGKAP